MALAQLSPEALGHIADYFRTLAEPTRLRVLHTLGEGELPVREIASRVHSSMANVSRHLTQLARGGLVQRESRGNCAYYRISDPVVHELCDLVCRSLVQRYERNLHEQTVRMPPDAEKSLQETETPRAA